MWAGAKLVILIPSTVCTRATLIPTMFCCGAGRERRVRGDMMSSNEFTDVTLVTDNKQQIRAHRNILSACSPVFKNILQIESNNTNPVIYLRGIQHSEMESIMQFIYLGETRFSKDRMSEFLLISKNLAIKELSTGINMNEQTVSNDESNE